MRRFLGIILAAATSFGAVACAAAQSVEDPTYCDTQITWLTFHLSDGSVEMADTLLPLPVQRTSEAIGFIAPVPISLPRSADVTAWTLDGHEFTAHQTGEGRTEIQTIMMERTFPTYSRGMSASALRAQTDRAAQAKLVPTLVTVLVEDGEVQTIRLSYPGSGASKAHYVHCRGQRLSVESLESALTIQAPDPLAG